jgi:coenzyme F420 hydrogenase subunit beta
MRKSSSVYGWCMMNTIERVVVANLCTGCGICAGICPNNAISMIIRSGIYLPEVNYNECVECQLCLKSCPGYEVDFKELNNHVFGEQPNNEALGHCIQCFTGYSVDKTIRFDSSSGGIVTQLLVYALEHKIIDGAIVTSMSENNPLEPKVIVARTKEAIIHSSRSKYCPVTINEGISEILKKDGKYAVVGLPCHIQGIRKAQMHNQILANRIVFTIGLVCAKSSNFEATRFFLKTIHVSEKNIRQIDYRGSGWPGGMTITFSDYSKKFIPFSAYRATVGSMLFVPQRCLLCSDALSELADITVGDAWLKTYTDDTSGRSIVFIRSKRGEIFVDACRAQEIVASETNFLAAVGCERKLLQFKKRDLITRMRVWKFFERPLPKYVFATSIDLTMKSSVVSRLLATVRYIIFVLVSKSGKLPDPRMNAFNCLMKFVLRLSYIRYGRTTRYWHH